MIEVTNPFLKEMQGLFGPLPIDPVPGGEIQRFRVPGAKPGALNNLRLLQAGRSPADAFCSWRQSASRSRRSRKPSRDQRRRRELYYEDLKREIARTATSSEEYEHRCRDAARKAGI